MMTWIVTGGVASGKSQFCRMLGELAPATAIFSSDEVVRQIYEEKDFVAGLVKDLGVGILGTDSSLSRAALRELAFRDQRVRKMLEARLHPLVYKELGMRREAESARGMVQLLIAEVPLFYESGQDFPADDVIVVATQAHLQHARLTGERGLNADTAQRILSIQLPLLRKLDQAGKVVWNEGSMELLNLQAKLLLQQIAKTDA